MTFEQYVDEIFIDHHDCSGYDHEEIRSLIEESTWDQRFKWLKNNGYEELIKEYDLNISYL